jgi:hypothetical protein
MTMQIGIEIQNKIAKRIDPKAFIVCGNSDYTLKFTFDEEWAEYEVKTARFYSNGEPEDVVFKGDECPVPVMERADGVFIGVFAGDLKTTTKAYIPCERCILCLGGKIKEPTPDVYAQLMQMINDGMIRGEQGEKGEKGDKGDAGSITFKPVSELPTENIDNSVIYLVPIEGDGDNTFAEYVYIDGKWELLGSVALNVDHSEYVKFTDYATASKAGVAAFDNRGVAIDKYGRAYVLCAYENEINGKVNPYRPIVPAKLDYATMSALSDCKDTTIWTDDKTENGETVKGTKTKACETIGAYPLPLGTNSGTDKIASWTDRTKKLNYRALQAEIGATTVPIRRGATNNFDVGTPQTDSECANKQYVDDNFVAKTDTSSTNMPNSVAMRNDRGAIVVGDPEEDNEAVPLEYFNINKGTKLYLHEIKWGMDAGTSTLTFISNSDTQLSTYDDFYNYYSKNIKTVMNEKLGSWKVISIITGGPSSLGGDTIFYVHDDVGAISTVSAPKSNYQSDTVTAL